MLGLFLIYYLGKSFYTLAEEYEKSRWGYAVLGVVSYYGGTMIAGILLFIVVEGFSDGNVEDISDIVLNIIALPFGILGAYLMYKFLEKRFKGETVSIISDSTILDDEML
jgi:glycopeptide antibiotics resistance protein